jgi:hypothetical protein
MVSSKLVPLLVTVSALIYIAAAASPRQRQRAGSELAQLNNNKVGQVIIFNLICRKVSIHWKHFHYFLKQCKQVIYYNVLYLMIYIV